MVTLLRLEPGSAHFLIDHKETGPCSPHRLCGRALAMLSARNQRQANMSVLLFLLLPTPQHPPLIPAPP